MLEQDAYDAGEAHVYMTKVGGDATTAYSLSGELYLSKSGWLLCDVPNALVRGAFQALHEPGAELPPQHNGSLNAHITIMRPEEIESIGGADKITERGKRFSYTLGPLKEVEPAGWADMSRCWFIEVSSPALKTLRKSYGLTPLPKNDTHPFHITVSVRRRHVLRHNDTSKAASSPAGPDPKPAKKMTVAVDMDDTLIEYDGWKGEDHFGALRPGALAAMKAFRDEGYNIVIWTCRGAEDKVRKYLDDNKVPYDYVNENPHQPANTSQKVVADVYIDDRAVDGRQSWDAIRKEVSSRMVKHAAILMPAVRVGGLALDIAGLQAISGHGAPEPPDPVMQILEDRSYLGDLRGRRRKAKVRPAAVQMPNAEPVQPDPLAKVADYYRERHTPSVHRPTAG